MLIIPGNQRVRIVDFSRGLCRVMLKAGFDQRAIASEVAVRGPGCSGPFITLTTVDLEAGWFEEPLLMGFNLARCPPWRDRAELMRQAFGALETWSAPSCVPIDARDYAAQQAARVGELLGRVEAAFGPEVAVGIPAKLAHLQTAAATLGMTRTSRGHGDFQAANVMVESASGRVFIADWEYSGRRFVDYDLLRWGLGAGSPPGLAKRVQRFLSQGTIKEVGLHLPRLRDPGWRSGALGIFLIEEQIRVLEETLSGTYHTPVLWSRLHKEIRQIEIPPR